MKCGRDSVQVCGCISAAGVGDLVRIEGAMNTVKYMQILIHHSIPSGRMLIGDNFVFQHDNDSKYTSNVLKTYLQRRAESGTQICRIAPLKVLTLTSYYKLSGIIRTGRKKNFAEYVEQTPMEFLQKLQESISKGISAVLHEKGDNTKF